MGIVKRFQKKSKKREKSKHRKAVQKKYLDQIFPELVVKNGPFSGMKYPSAASVGSTLFPKLLGSYERELSGVLQKICGTNYSDIVDIGCAEGYYAVGLSMVLPNANIYAYDVSDVARKQCREMFTLNSINKSRYSIGEFCDSDTLTSLKLGNKALILSDCEGCEKTLFNSKVRDKLSCHDLLIEAHDCIDIEISTYLSQLFESTHNITIVESVDDIQKAKRYAYPEISHLNLDEKRIVLGERRSSIMEWLFLESKAPKA